MPNSHASTARSVHYGAQGAVSAAHPLAVSAGLEILTLGGNACDAMIAAQAVLAVVAPASCGIGGDMLALIRNPDGEVLAINGTGKSPRDPRFTEPRDGGLSITVPGLVAGWADANQRSGRISLGACLAPAIRLAQNGCKLATDVARAIRDQQVRLAVGLAADWIVVRQATQGGLVVQRELGRLLAMIADHGREAFYRGEVSDWIEAAAARANGLLSSVDLASHKTEICVPISAGLRGGRIHVQPPMTQGVLLAMCLRALERTDIKRAACLDHLCVELTEASFQYRDRVSEGEALLEIDLPSDPDRASRRGGPRSYLHTAGVATADSEGMVCSSLVSVFDDFGSCIYVPEGGFVLNNRAKGFTSPPNEPAPNKLPVHTLAPAIWEKEGQIMALATPGADGQIQTLLQVLSKIEIVGASISEAIHAPRWRSEDGKLLVAENHPAGPLLGSLGHDIELRKDGDLCFGGVVIAGISTQIPFAGSDWRREVWHGVV